MKAPVRTGLFAILGVFAASFSITVAVLILFYSVSFMRTESGTSSTTPSLATSTTTPAEGTSTSTPSTPPVTKTSTPETNTPSPSSSSKPSTPPPVNTTLFAYNFNSPGVLQEAGSMSNSTSPYWFLDSGGELIIQNGIGETVQGSLPTGSKWQSAYASSNPTDTDGGYHPQNIFRLVTKATWQNSTSEAYYYIAADNLSSSSNRNASNGLLLMNRYLDHNDLYYAGIRVDGTAVIKKKIGGTYYTMAQIPIFLGTYDPSTNPNLLPHQTWIGLRTTTTTNADGTVSISLFMSRDSGATWTLLTSATDKGQYGGTAPITSAGAFGIRTDFMDVQFKNIRVTAG